MKSSKNIVTNRHPSRRFSVSPGRLAGVLSLAVALAGAGQATAQITATLTDIGYSAPDPGADDISQLTVPSGPNSPDGLNYYFNNNPPPGQTFTTGANPNGYTLTSLAFATAGNGGQLSPNGQAYLLRFYSVSGSNATLIATFASQPNFLFSEYDWLQWSDLSLGLQPNTQYAYSFQAVSAGWENLANVTNNPYAGGEVALIPTAGGAMTFGSSHNFDAAFDVGLSPATALTANPPVAAPAGAVLAGTAVTISTAPAAGPGPFTYQWQTDGGSGGALTNIPSATGTTLPVNTTGLAPGLYSYDVVVANSSGSVTSTVVSVSVYQVGGATLSDVGSSLTPGGFYDISQLIAGGSPTPADGLNYYDDNNTPPSQTFTTGSNPQGYTLNSVSIGTGGGTYNSTTTPQVYNLWIYQVNGSTASLLANYTNASFGFTYGDWITWSGFTPLILKPNTTYAYSFRRNTAGWAGMAVTPGDTDVYAGGQICLIPQAGGTITYGNSGMVDAAFDLGLLPVGVETTPLAGPISISPSSIVTAGTSVTFSEAATGVALHYIWRTDDGSGGALTNIPASDATNLVQNTTGWKPGTYRYAVVITNTYGSVTSSVVSVTITYADTTASLADIGAIDPLPVVDDDIAQLITGGGKPDGLNYYTDNSTPPGQTFLTGSNPNGYTLTSLAIHTAGDSGTPSSLPAAGQAYQLRIFTVTGSTAVLYATYTSQGDFTFVDSDWLRWSGLNLPLSPNTTYAYSFGKIVSGSGWENLGNTAGNPYAGGEVALIPISGGTITFGASHDFDATFVVGLAVAGRPNVSPTVFSPTNVAYAGSPVTVSAAVSGTGPFTYQWQTDGGNTGNMANIPGANGPTLSADTTGLDGLIVAYRLIVSNGAGSTTNEPAMLIVNPASAPFVLAGLDTTPSSADRFVGGSVTFTATFGGTLPIAYQWRVDKGSGPVDIAGQTNATLTLANLGVSDSASYSLHAVNAIGSADSTPATLAVHAQPSAPMTVNFQYRSFEGGNDVGIYTGPGIPGFGSGTYWNQVFVTNNAALSPVYADDGVTVSGFGFSLTRNGSWCYTSTPTIPILDDGAEAHGTGPQSFTFTLPNGLHNIVLFSCNGNESISGKTTSATIFTINGVTKTTAATTDLSFIEGNNYVVFSNVVVTGGSLTGTYTAAPGASFGNLNGASVRYLGPLNTNPALISAQLTGGQLSLSWPADHAGWTLQVQTNSLSVGLGTNWVDVAGSSAVTQMNIPINTANGSAFYRLILK